MRLSLTCLFSFIAFLSIGQKETGSTYPNFENANPKNISLYSFSKMNSDSVCVIAFLRGKGKGYILDKTGKQINQFLFDCPFNNAQLLGGIITDGIVTFLMGKDKQENELLLYRFPIGQQQVTPITISSPIPNNKQLIGICQFQDAISFIGVDKEKPLLRIHKLMADNLFSITEYDFSDLFGKEYQKGKFYDKINERSSMLQIKMAIIDDANTVPIQLLTCHKKLYLAPNSMTLTIESRDKTDVFFVDVANNQHHYKQLNNKCADCANHDLQYISYNTFLFNDNIFSVVACKDALEIKAINIDRNQILKNLIVHEKDEILFKNTAVVEEIDSKSLLTEEISEKEIGKTKKILKKMAYGWSVMTARIDSLQRIELTIGGYLPNTNANSQAGAFLAGGLIGGALWGMFMPVSMSGNDWSNTIHFKTLFDPKSLQHIDGAVNLGPNDYVNNYKISKELGDIPETMFRLSSNYGYAFIHPKTGKLTFIDLPN